MESFLAIIAISLFLGGHRPDQETVPVHLRTITGFEDASRLAIDLGGRMLVVDRGAQEILLYPAIGDTPITVGGAGWSLGSFDDPSDVCTDGVNIYVADFGNHRIQRFDRLLRPLSAFCTRDTNVQEARFGFPRSVGLSESGDVFVLDGENRRVVKFSSTLTFDRAFGGSGFGSFSLSNPQSLDIVSSHVVVSESNRILVFDLFGNPIRIIADSTLQGITSVSSADGALVAVTQQTIVWMGLDAEIKALWPVGHMLADRPIKDVRDAAIVLDLLYLLTSHELFVFRLTE